MATFGAIKVIFISKEETNISQAHVAVSLEDIFATTYVSFGQEVMMICTMMTKIGHRH